MLDHVLAQIVAHGVAVLSQEQVLAGTAF